MLDCHFLRRWRDCFVVQAAATDLEQDSLCAERQYIISLLDQLATLGVAQDGNFFFKKLT